METLAYLHCAALYEDDAPATLRSLDELNLQLPTSIALGLLATGILTTTLGHADSAQALMRTGDVGPGVAQLQRELGISADRIYGSQTAAAVRAFQRRIGLRADGIAGAETLDALGLPVNLGPGGGSTQQPVSGNAVVTTPAGLIIRNRPAGYAIGDLAYRDSVALTGDRRFVAGRYWAELASGGWVAEQYLSYSGNDGNNGGEVPIDTGAYVTARIGLAVRDRPGGSQIGGLDYLAPVELSGDSRYAAGRTWLQLASGGWVAEEYIRYR